MCIKVCEGCAGCVLPAGEVKSVLIVFCLFVFQSFFSRIFAILEGNVLLSRISGSCSAYRKQTPSVIKQSLYVFPSFLLPSDESEIMKSNSPPPTNCYQWEIFSVAAYKSELGSQAGQGGRRSGLPPVCLPSLLITEQPAPPSLPCLCLWLMISSKGDRPAPARSWSGSASKS